MASTIQVFYVPTLEEKQRAMNWIDGWEKMPYLVVQHTSEHEHASYTSYEKVEQLQTRNPTLNTGLGYSVRGEYRMMGQKSKLYEDPHMFFYSSAVIEEGVEEFRGRPVTWVKTMSGSMYYLGDPRGGTCEFPLCVHPKDKNSRSYCYTHGTFISSTKHTHSQSVTGSGMFSTITKRRLSNKRVSFDHILVDQEEEET